MEPIASSAAGLVQRVPVEPGGVFFVSLERGAVEITSHDAEEIQLEARARGPGSELVEFTVLKEGRDVFLDMGYRSWIARLAPMHVKLRARIPRRCGVDVETRGGRIELYAIGGDCGVRTSGGRIEVEGVDGHVSLRTSGGAIHVQDVTGSLEAETSGGRILATGVGGDCEVTTSGGSVEVVDVVGGAWVETSGGKVRVQFSDAPAGRLRTSGGSIEVEYPAGFGVDLDARTSGGRVDVAPEIDVAGRSRSHEVRARLDGGGDLLELRTSGGSIRIAAPAGRSSHPRPGGPHERRADAGAR